MARACRFGHTNIAQVEIVNSSKVQVQINGFVPTVHIERSAGVELFLSRESEGTEFLTTAASEVNISTQPINHKGHWVEHAVPQTLSSTFQTTGEGTGVRLGSSLQPG